ncbi:MAG: hypothetical protein KDA45_16180, partial [Planctomycetales bacterium]|nr:hypothetical protein [Planctomycetales bacterium]
MLTENLDNLDKILDELEELARSDLSSARFYPVLVERLRLSVQAISAAFWLPIEDGGWLPLAHSGPIRDAMGQVLQQQLASPQSPTATPGPEWLLGKVEGQAWCAIPVRPRQFSKGCLVVCLAQPLPEQTFADFLQWLTAFAEVIALRQNAEVEKFLNDDWERMQTLCGQLPQTVTIEEACSLLAAGLPQTLRASRVSLMTPTSTGGLVVRAVSGVPDANGRTPALRALRELGLRTLRTGLPEWRQQPAPAAAEQPLVEMNEDGTFANAIIVPLCGQPRQRAARVAVALE